MNFTFFKKASLLALFAGLLVSQVEAKDPKKEYKKFKKEHQSSSSCTCSVRDEVSELHSDVKNCCTKLKEDIAEIFDTLNATSPCSQVQVIDMVPFVITTSGKYCVTKDLVYNGAGAAITVQADDVSINFHNHSLTLTNSAAEGILVQDVREFTLENDMIAGSSIFRTPTSAAIHLQRVTKATLKELYTLNTTKGIFIEDSRAVDVLHAHLEAHESDDTTPPSGPSIAPLTIVNNAVGAGIWIQNSQDVSVQDCHFQSPDLDFSAVRVNVAFHVEGDSENISLLGSTFSEWYSSINVLKVNNLLVDGCDIKAATNSSLHGIQIGDCLEGNSANGIIIQNTNIRKYPTEQINFEGIFLVNGSGCEITNVTVNPASFQYYYSAAPLHVGLFDCGTYSDVVVKNSVFGGINSMVVNLESARNVLIENCKLTGQNFEDPIVNLLDAEGCWIKDCSISDGVVGVYFNNTSGMNSVTGCQIWNQSNCGILVTESEGASPNHISNNSLFNNGTGISIPVGSRTEVFFNTSCNNTLDCQNPNTTFFIAQQPGDSPVAAGFNLCCVLED